MNRGDLVRITKSRTPGKRGLVGIVVGLKPQTGLFIETIPLDVKTPSVGLWTTEANVEAVDVAEEALLRCERFTRVAITGLAAARDAKDYPEMGRIQAWHEHQVDRLAEGSAAVRVLKAVVVERVWAAGWV